MPDRDLPVPRWPLYLGIAAAWTLLGLFLTLSPTVPNLTARAFIDLGYVLLPLAGLVAAARRIPLQTGRRRIGWTLFAVGFASWSLAGVYWTYHEVFLGQTPPFPSPSDAGFVAYAVLGAAALWFLGQQWGPRLQGHEVLDVAFIGVATAYAAYDLALEEAFAASAEPLTRLASIAYPAADTAILTIAIFMVARATPGRRMQPALIGGGLALLAVWDTTWIYLTAHGLYVSGGPLDLLWHISFILVVCGLIYRQHDTHELGEESAPAARFAVPVVLTILVAALAVVDHLRERLDALELVLLALLLVLVVTRQTAALLQNERLRLRVAATARDLEAANVKLREAAAFRTQFINATAHELSNPLTPLKIHASLLRDPGYGADQSNREQSANMLTRNIERLIRLVDDLLELARLESGKVSIRPEPTDLARLARETAELYQATAAEKSVRIQVEAPDKVPAMTDPQRIVQVMGNLLSNSIKYSPENEKIELQVSDEAQAVMLRVRDRGVGLTPEQQARLFRPFSQVQPRGAQKTGTGLGLYICSTLVERLGGAIGAESDGPGTGTAFWVRIPKTLAEAAFAPGGNPK